MFFFAGLKSCCHCTNGVCLTSRIARLNLRFAQKADFGNHCAGNSKVDIDYSIVQCIAQSIDRSFDQTINCSMDQSTVWSINRSIDWSAPRRPNHQSKFFNLKRFKYVSPNARRDSKKRFWRLKNHSKSSSEGLKIHPKSRSKAIMLERTPSNIIFFEDLRFFFDFWTPKCI